MPLLPDAEIKAQVIPPHPAAVSYTHLILEMNHITKEFPGVKALKDVTFKVRKGVVHGLMGENGAGKSLSLIHILVTWLKEIFFFTYSSLCLNL